MSELKAIWERCEEDIEKLRKKCPHKPSHIIKFEDGSGIGKGCCTETVIIMCVNCGKSKYIYGLNNEQKKKVKKQLKRQGFKDERIGGYGDRRDFRMSVVMKKLEVLERKKK